MQVVFRGGETALQILPPLVDVLPEARLNLIIYHLRRGICNKCAVLKIRGKANLFLDDVLAAFDLVKDLEPASPNEYILKAVVHCLIGQMETSVKP